ncbi:hypothetical protein M9Y10_003379 [Tritrichomonas musculus]|uniref:Protein kinase domain-containing protein n=1 Tax=Tritrichomonas musculus TaxID=1915356 RepID=A0ABR2JPA1_9EUKA
MDRFSKYKGNFKYYAPEVYFFKNYSKASDVFAFSVVCYEIFQQEKLFRNKNFFEYIQGIVNDKKRPADDYDFYKVPIYYKELIQKCWPDDPTKRLSFDEIVHFLKADTNLIDNEEFQKYVKLCDESLIDYDPTQEIHLFDDIINSPISKVEKKIFDLENYDKNIENTNIFGTFYIIENKDSNENILHDALDFLLANLQKTISLI